MKIRTRLRCHVCGNPPDMRDSKSDKGLCSVCDVYVPPGPCDCGQDPHPFPDPPLRPSLQDPDRLEPYWYWPLSRLGLLIGLDADRSK